MEKLNWKVILAILILLLIVIVILIFLTGRINKPNQVQQSNLQTYQDTNFSLSYPKSVVINSAAFSGGDRGLVFNLPQGADYNMDLEIIPSTATNNAQIIDSILQIEFPGTNIKDNGIAGKEFSGSTTIGGQIAQQRTVVLENKGLVYKLQLIYYANQPNLDVDNLFSQILSTLKFN